MRPARHHHHLASALLQAGVVPVHVRVVDQPGLGCDQLGRPRQAFAVSVDAEHARKALHAQAVDNVRLLAGDHDLREDLFSRDLQ